MASTLQSGTAMRIPPAPPFNKAWHLEGTPTGWQNKRRNSQRREVTCPRPHSQQWRSWAVHLPHVCISWLSGKDRGREGGIHCGERLPALDSLLSQTCCSF